MKAQAQAIYNSLVNDTKLMPLSSFKSNKFSKYNLFPQAHALPPFFDNNLQSESRVVKYLKGPQGPLRAFYYQLFKLAFEVDNSNQDYTSIIKNIVFDPNLSTYSASPTSGKQYNINQYKRIIADYIKLMESQVIPNAELTFNQYPIIDEAMLAILELILEKYLAEATEKIQNMFQLLTVLCQMFSITLEVYDTCYSFAESDVFLYPESKDACYLAFLSEMAEIQSHERTSESQDLKDNLSNSYTDSKDQSLDSPYKKIRLSAGNRGARARPLNRSVPTSKTIYGTSSFGESDRHTRRKYHEGISQERGEEEEDYKYGTKQEVEKNVFESSSLEGESQDHIQVLEPEKVRKQEEQKPTSLDETPNGSVKQIRNGNGGKKVSEEESEVTKIPEAEGKYVKTLYEMKTHKTIFDSGIHTRMSSEDVMNEAEEPKNAHQVNKKSMVKVNNEVFQYEFKSGNYQYTQDLSGMVDKIISHSHIVQPESYYHILTNNNIPISISSVSSGEPKLNIENKKSEILQPTSNQSIIHQLTSPAPVSGYQNKKPTDNATQPHRPLTINTIVNSLASIMSPPNTPPGQAQFDKDRGFKNMAAPILRLQENPDAINFFSPKVALKSEQGIRKVQFHDKGFDQKIIETGQMLGLRTKPKEIANDDTLGTFYRQFTDTRVMEIMIEPYKTKVKTTRKRFKGIRSKDFRGFN